MPMVVRGSGLPFWATAMMSLPVTGVVEPCGVKVTRNCETGAALHTLPTTPARRTAPSRAIYPGLRRIRGSRASALHQANVIIALPLLLHEERWAKPKTPPCRQAEKRCCRVGRAEGYARRGRPTGELAGERPAGSRWRMFPARPSQVDSGPPHRATAPDPSLPS